MVKPKYLISAAGIIGLVGGTALAPDPVERVQVETGYSKRDQRAMEELHASLPEARKLPPVSKMGMPPKKGIHWLSLARVAAQTPEDGFTEALNAYEQGRMR